MHVTYSDKARQHPEEYAILQQATRSLEEVIGASAERIRVEWDRLEDGHDQPSFLLYITDGTDSATISIRRDLLKNPSRLYIRLLLLWDDLLKERNHRQFRALEAMSASEN